MHSGGSLCTIQREFFHQLGDRGLVYDGKLIMAGLLLLTEFAECGDVAAAEGAFVAVQAKEGNVEGAVLEERSGEDRVGSYGGGMWMRRQRA